MQSTVYSKIQRLFLKKTSLQYSVLSLLLKTFNLQHWRDPDLLLVAHALHFSKILVNKGKEDLGVIIVLNLATLRTHVGRYTENQLIGDHPSQILIETTMQTQPLQSRNSHLLLSQVLSPRNNLKCSKSF